MGWKLGELAERFGLTAVGDRGTAVHGVCTLDPGEPACISFLANPRYRRLLAGSRAGAVVLTPEAAQGWGGNGLLAKDPYLAYARIAALFDDTPALKPGVHPAAVVEPGARVDPAAEIAAFALVGEGARVAAGAYVGPGCVIGPGAEVGAQSRLEARVVLARRCRIGARCRILPGAVIGGRGFGLAKGPKGWEEVPQLGRVLVGDDVEVGANTTIDRGAIEDTVIGNGVKLDNQIQVAHNVRIGDHTAIAACAGIAGSAVVGARCMIGGGSGIAGHIEIGDDVVILAYTLVTKSQRKPGAYGSGLPSLPVREWRRMVGGLRRLGRSEARLAAIERELKLEPPRGGELEADEHDP